MTSLKPTTMPLRLTAIILGFQSISTASLMIWLMAKAPIRTGSSFNPASRSWKPKVRRIWPSDGSMPGMAKTMPRQPAIRPLIIEPWASEASITSAIKTMVKYSQGPNRRASLASGGLRPAMKHHEIRPPTKDDVMPRPSARPG